MSGAVGHEESGDVPSPAGSEAIEIAKEIVSDLRSELPRVDARAAAGIALSAAILVGVVGQAPTAMPVYALAVAAAVLLTVAILLFLLVLLPTPTLITHQSLVHAAAEPVEAAGDGGGPAQWPHAAAGGDRTLEGTLDRLNREGRRLATQLHAMDHAEYLGTIAVQLAAQLHSKQRTSMLAFLSGSTGVAVLAFGASWALLLGWR